MNIELPKKKRKLDEITSDEIKKWAKEMEEKIKNMENPNFFNAARQVLPADIHIDSRRSVENLIVSMMSPEVREMIKARPAKLPPLGKEKKFTPKQLKWMAKSAQRKIWREEKRAGQSEEDSNLI